MKKVILLSFLFLFLSNGTGYWDFDRAKKEGLPPTYMFGREENTFNGYLNRACSGSECPATNTLSQLYK